ncbi:MAG TPA: hypothetical protein VKU60_19955 [Chloroflexota bacterium]|nr:hypothetical protein [Chloroflexota bacterium]
MSPEEYSYDASPVDLAEALSTMRPIPTRRGQSRPVFVQTTDSALNKILPFMALSVGIDNPTNQWFFLMSEGRWIPPFLVGARWKLLTGTTQAQGSWTPPPGGANSATASFATQLTLAYSSDDLLEVAGLRLAA